MTLIIWGIIVVVISVSISVFIMRKAMFKLFKEVLDHYEKHIKRLILIETIVQGMLVEKDEQGLLEMLKDTQAKIEEIGRASCRERV